MLTLEQYNLLNENEKADAIIKGDFLGDLKDSGRIVQLYSMGKIYGELYFDQAANEIISVRAFDRVFELAPYLDLTNMFPRL